MCEWRESGHKRNVLLTCVLLLPFAQHMVCPPIERTINNVTNIVKQRTRAMNSELQNCAISCEIKIKSLADL